LKKRQNNKRDSRKNKEGNKWDGTNKHRRKVRSRNARKK
jgi:hypothetical protein